MQRAGEDIRLGSVTGRFALDSGYLLQSSFKLGSYPGFVPLLMMGGADFQ
jgi:hypothetical protein